MLASIIIPTYNQVGRLQLTLNSLAKQEMITECEVIVINDGSSDATKSYLDELTYPWLYVIHQENKGRSYTRNKGLKIARGEVIILLDGDIVIQEDFIKAHLACQKRTKGVYISNIQNIRGDNYEKFVEAYSEHNPIDQLVEKDILVNMASDFSAWNQSPEVSWVCMVGASTSISREYMQKMDGFDTNFVGWGVEDHEFAYRLKLEGARFFFLEDVKVYHLDQIKGEIQIECLLENIIYFRRKYIVDQEVESYTEFITGRRSIKCLFEETMKKTCVDLADLIYFKPMKHLEVKKGNNHAN